MSIDLEEIGSDRAHRFAHKSMNRRRQTPTTLPNLVDIDTLAAHLGVSVRHVRRLVVDRRVPFLKWGHLLRFDPAEIAAWLEESRVAPSSASMSHYVASVTAPEPSSGTENGMNERGGRRNWGSVRRLASRRWQARYRDDAGHLQSAPHTFVSKGDASRWLSTVEVDRARGEWLDPRLGATHFDAFVDEWLPTMVHLRPTTRGTSARARRHDPR
jgi:excisionase family DNA binding protein